MDGPVAALARRLRRRARPGAGAVRSRGPASRLDRRKQFSLLIVRGDGARVFTLNFPRRLPVALVCAGLVAGLGVAALAGDWWHIRLRMRDSASLIRQIDEQDAVITAFDRTVADLAREVASWRDLHTRIWESFGPEVARTRESGIGGRTAPADRVTASATPSEALHRLTEQVLQQGESLRALERLMARARRALAALPSHWPVRGRVTSEFGTRPSPWTKTPEFHGGLDIGTPTGTPVRAPAAGTVAVAGPHGEFGLAVVLEHGNDLRTIYGHLSKVLVRPGQHVERGTQVGVTGNTGRSSGPHLHYEVLLKGRSVNPRGYLWE
jgi:murein DD-endopeptidase MepM/ murein hydrolase activator NlpD